MSVEELCGTFFYGGGEWCFLEKIRGYLDGGFLCKKVLGQFKIFFEEMKKTSENV